MINILKDIIGDTTLIQIALNKQGFGLLVDGLIGSKTKSAYYRCNRVLFEKDLSKLLDNVGDIPQYLRIAFKELGIREISGFGSNPEIEKYHDFAGIGWAKDDIPWCGSFIAYCIKKACIDISSVRRPASSLSWLKFGKEVHYPAYGSLAIKKRKGGGHITFVIGVSSDGRYCYCLGGNQSDMVKISKYRVDNFISFRLPYCYKEKNVVKDMNVKRNYKEQ